MSIALVFPGQGSQCVGMGRSLYEQSEAAREVFERADRALGDTSLSSVCFDGPEENLTLTANAQPAILVVSLAALAALRERVLGIIPTYFAGHSLGEYSALVAAESMSLEDAVRVVRRRGTAMQEAVAPGVGAMAACLLLEDSVVEELCAETRAALPERVVSVANVNAPGQVVISGHTDAVSHTSALVEARGGKSISLSVSAPFHCSLMRPAAEALSDVLSRVSFRTLSAPVVANVDAMPNTDPDRARELLIEQVTAKVRWRETVARLASSGVDTFIELGPGKVLSGLIKRSHRGAKVLNVSDAESLAATITSLGRSG